MGRGTKEGAGASSGAVVAAAAVGRGLALLLVLLLLFVGWFRIMGRKLPRPLRPVSAWRARMAETGLFVVLSRWLLVVRG